MRRRSLALAGILFSLSCSAEPGAESIPLAPLDDALFERITELSVSYHVSRGEQLSEVLQRWSDDAGWSLIYSAPDVTMEAGMTFPAGTPYRSAVSDLLGALWPHHGLRATAYLRNAVLVIEIPGN